MTDTAWYAWVMEKTGEPLARRSVSPKTPGPGEALVEVAGCGVCHTDISFLYGGVKTRANPPLVLGHEISGIVRAVGGGVSEDLVGHPVVIPAVLPCGECDLCRAGRRTICRKQVMPGNDRDGGFASHVVVPARFLCAVAPRVLAQQALWELAVVSDAVATPFEAVKRSGLTSGELAVFVGVGGIGVHGVQVAGAHGARVIALDIDAEKLQMACVAGANATLNVRGMNVKDVRREVRAKAEGLGAPPHLWKIFETSGTRPGQETAYGLLGFGATLSIVGYTTDRVEVSLSQLMAYDAVARGNWGADPLVYPELLEWIADGRIRLTPFVERHPLDDANAVLDDAHHGRLTKRAVLVP